MWLQRDKDIYILSKNKLSESNNKEFLFDIDSESEVLCINNKWMGEWVSTCRPLNIGDQIEVYFEEKKEEITE